MLAESKTSRRVVIVDYGAGNTGSVKNMVMSLGLAPEVSKNPEVIRSASHLILPGVGHFDHAMSNLRHSSLIPTLSSCVLHQRTPILGICLGIQLFCKSSEEGTEEGLGWLNASVKRIPVSPTSPLKLPHMGWNRLNIQKADYLLSDLSSEDTRFYFVHSYHVSTSDKQDIVATTDYGTPVTAVIRKNNIMGTQFHPEKSHRFGRTLIRNFLNIQQCDQE